MASINSHADVITDWEGLLEAWQRTPEMQASLEPERQLLVDSLTEVQTLKARQQELTALRQEVTQQLRAAVARGKEVAIRVRSVVRGKMGPRNERIVHFNVAPLRKRTRKPKEAETPAGGTPAPGATPGSGTEEASASPSGKPAA